MPGAIPPLLTTGMVCGQLFALYPLLDSNIKGVDMTCSVSWILFDFGGVLAEEGFRGGLGALREQGLDIDRLEAMV